MMVQRVCPVGVECIYCTAIHTSKRYPTARSGSPRITHGIDSFQHHQALECSWALRHTKSYRHRLRLFSQERGVSYVPLFLLCGFVCRAIQAQGLQSMRTTESGLYRTAQSMSTVSWCQRSRSRFTEGMQRRAVSLDTRGCSWRRRVSLQETAYYCTLCTMLSRFPTRLAQWRCHYQRMEILHRRL